MKISTQLPPGFAVTRRAVLHGVGRALALAPFAPLLACSSSGAVAADGGARADTGTGSDAGAGADAAGGWATGGTASMSGNYPDPFTSGLGGACVLTCAATLGPCYAATETRMDISEGHDGLPVRLAFLVVDEACAPIEGASVDVWHAAPEGVYSGNDASAMCTLNDANAVARRFFRGVQVTSAAGRADFNSCFPGWYTGRTIHIHFTVRVNGVASVTSQLFFDDTLADDIVASQPLYDDRGARDTKNTNDSVISASAVGDYTFKTQRMADGAMLASKVLVLRSSSAASCAVPGGTGGGGPGGPPLGG